MTRLRFLGDVHQKYEWYLPLLRDVEHSIQIGDLGMDYKYLQGKLDVSRHKFFGGNHECYDKNSEQYCLNHPNCLGDFGIHQIEDRPTIFFIRGAWSIDHKWRQGGIPTSWWPEEELSYGQLEEAIQLYKEVRPQIVVSHEAPISVVPFVTNPKFCEQFGYPAGTIRTRTNTALQAMLDFHKPTVWIFGHYHCSWRKQIDDTLFVCLDMLRGPFSNVEDSYLDWEEVSHLF